MMPIKDHIKDEKNYFHFKLDRNDVYKHIVYGKFLEKHLKAKSPSLVRIFNKYNDLFKLIEMEVSEEIKQDTINYSKNIYNYFKRNVEFKKPPFSLVLFDFITDIVEDLINLRFEGKFPVHKGNYSRTAYMAIQKQFEEYNKKNNKLEISHYQIGLITAYTGLVFGIQFKKSVMVSYKENSLTTKELFDAVRSPIKKFDKKKKRTK